MNKEEGPGPLTDAEAVEIRRLYFEEKWSQGRIARKFKRAVGSIGRITRFETHARAEEKVAAGGGNNHPLRLSIEDEQAKEVAASEERLRQLLGVGPEEEKK